LGVFGGCRPVVAGRVVGSPMKLCIADPPYLGRAVRWYGQGGCGDGYGKGQADNHPDAALWDDPASHIELINNLQSNFDGWVIALSVHSLSTYLSVIETNSRNGIRIGVWYKPSASPSGSRIGNHWEPVIVKVPNQRKGRTKHLMNTQDVLIANPNRKGFVGSKPVEWTHWVLDLMGYQTGDEVIDLFSGSGSVTEAIKCYQQQTVLQLT
jgi:hypothetical protein